jgi:muconate cycloisomerase
LTEPGPGPVLAWNAARCAWELALVDLVLGKAGRSVGDILPPKRKSVAYSGVITSGSPEKAAKTARHLGAFGIRTLKIKTGGPQDAEVVAAVRQAAGPTAALRVDANAAYAPEEAAARLAALAIHGIESAEQPIPRGDLAAWAALRAASPIPLMADESLVTLADGEALAAAGACDLFNIRLSKCGGFLPCLRLADVARRAGLRIQIGCQVGETALLSAAGRHLAAHLDDLAWVEGSFGTLLLSRDISRSKVQFGHGGNAPVLRGPGLGVDVDEEAPRAHAVAVIGREA